MTDAGEDRREGSDKGGTLAKETKSENGVVGSQTRRNHNVFTPHTKDLNVEVCIMTKTGWARSKVKFGNLLDGIEHSTKIGDMITADHNI